MKIWGFHNHAFKSVHSYDLESWQSINEMEDDGGAFMDGWMDGWIEGGREGGRKGGGKVRAASQTHRVHRREPVAISEGVRSVKANHYQRMH